MAGSVRALDVTGDWIFGIGKSAYLHQNAAIGQQIRSAVLSFKGDCIFDAGFGIDHNRFLGGKNSVGYNLAVSAQIMNVPGVQALIELKFQLNRQTREQDMTFQVLTPFSAFRGSFPLALGG